MPSTDLIRQYLLGAWRLMFGRQDGLKLLDTSADGFWDSFFAMVVALPPLLIGWIALANYFGEVPEVSGGKPSILVRLAVIELAVWLIPLIALALAARSAGIADRFVQYVVAINWSSALQAWIVLPVPLLRFVLPPDSGLLILATLVAILIQVVFIWRLTNATLNKGPAIATAVAAGIIAVGWITSSVLQSALGLYAGETPAG
jgi:hypothetical protein